MRHVIEIRKDKLRNRRASSVTVNNSYLTLCKFGTPCMRSSNNLYLASLTLIAFAVNTVRALSHEQASHEKNEPANRTN